jgi:hypothetical protein
MTLLDQSLIDGVTLSRQAVADTIGKAGKFLGEESEWRVVSFNPRSDDTLCRGSSDQPAWRRVRTAT